MTTEQQDTVQTKTITVDSRGRTNLGKMVEPGTYIVVERGQGSLLLIPADVVPRVKGYV